MKTAISMPDGTFERADRRARELGLNRSEFITRAIERYLRELDDGDDLTDRINAALDAAGEDDSNAVAAAHGKRQLLAATIDDEW